MDTLRRSLPIFFVLLTLGGASISLSGSQENQLRDVISSEIAVSENEATLRLVFPEEEAVEISFRNGRITVDGDSVGHFTRRDPLDASWRSLLGEAVALEPGRVGRTLLDWDPPEDLPGDAPEAARAVERALESALVAAPSTLPPGEILPAADPVDREQLREELRAELRDRIRSEVREELRSELRDELRRELQEAAPSSPFMEIVRTTLRPLRSVARGVASVIRTLFVFGVMTLLGVAAVHFLGPNLDVVSQAARRSPGRSALVGLAGIFLAFPVWILGIVVLAVSILGIPVLVAWTPLFPVAVALAVTLGYLAVAQNVGEWVIRRRIRGLERLRESNAIHTVAAGIAVLMLAFLAGGIVEMGGRWLGALRVLLVLTGWMAAIIAAVVGLGAVLLTRGGRRREPAFPSGPPPRPGGPGGEAPSPGAPGGEGGSPEPAPARESARHAGDPEGFEDPGPAAGEPGSDEASDGSSEAGGRPEDHG